MSRTQVMRLIRFLGFAIMLGATISVIVNAVIVVAVYKSPVDVSKEGAAISLYAVVLIVLASLLATAPLIEWWYNYLSRLFGITWNSERDHEAGSSDEKD